MSVLIPLPDSLHGPFLGFQRRRGLVSIGMNVTSRGAYEPLALRSKLLSQNQTMSTPRRLLEQNRAWSERMQATSPALFDDLAQGQSPDVLWIGCADSRVPASQVVDCDPGELFVHRNVANLVNEWDSNGMSVLQYAVNALEVSHVIVCGHHNCGGVRAVLTDSAEGALRDWLRPLQHLLHQHADELEGLDDQERWDRGCELNVKAQVQNIAQADVVRRGWEEDQDLTIHGWIYQLEDGRIRDLGVSVNATSFA